MGLAGTAYVLFAGTTEAIRTAVLAAFAPTVLFALFTNNPEGIEEQFDTVKDYEL